MISFEKLVVREKQQKDLEVLLFLSKDWEMEATMPAYMANGAEDFLNHELYVARENGRIIAYALGELKELTDKTSYNTVGELAFELEELYVCPAYRSQGIGRELYQFMEDNVKDRVQLVGVTAASYRYQELLRFYIEELGLDFKYAFLIKRM